MLNVGPWNRLPLTIRWLKQEYKMEFDADRQPPKHMPIAYGPLNKRKAKKGSKGDMEEAKDVTDYKCVECFKKIKVCCLKYRWYSNQLLKCYCDQKINNNSFIFFLWISKLC